MRSLSEIFVPGAPTLPEGLRTLVVSPERELEPGMTLRASFTFRNSGGAAATGVRVRFNLPDGLVYVPGSGRLDGTVLDDELGTSALLAASGAEIGEVPPAQERRIEIAYRVAGAIENGAMIELQAAVASFEVQPVGSNVARLLVRSRPALVNPLTTVSVRPLAEASAGSQAEITVRVHNAGESSAHGVAVVAPIPEHASYVGGSARVDGRELEPELGLTFDRVYAPVLASALSPGSSVALVYRIRLESPLPDGTHVTAHARVASEETPAFALDPAVLVAHTAPDFSDDRTTFAIEPATHVRSGERVTFTLVAHNAGTAAAENARLQLDLPESLLYVRGAARIDGRPVRERDGEGLVFELGPIEGGERLEFRCEAIATPPLSDRSTLDVAATLAWQPLSGQGARSFERIIHVRPEPVLARRANTIVRAGAESVRPGDEIEATIAITNDGNAATRDAVLALRIDPALEEARISERGERIPIEGGVAELGAIGPFCARRILFEARVKSPYADRSEIVVGASLTTPELGETQLGETSWRVDSHPEFAPATSRLELAGAATLRPNQVASVLVNVTNIGSDVARNVRVRLFVSPEARLESTGEATAEASSVSLGEIAAGASAKASLALKLVRSVPKEHPLTVGAVLTADSMLPVPLDQLTIVTTASADFSGGSLRSTPDDGAEPGESVEWTLHLRNGGDGAARQVQVRIAHPGSLIYVPNSTTVNGVPIRDAGAAGPLAGERGIVLDAFGPGVEATIRWRDVVHNQLAAGESIVRVAHVAYDVDRFDEIASGPLKVKAAPVFANTITGLSFGLEGLFAPADAAAHDTPTRDVGTYENGHAQSDVRSLVGTVLGYTPEWLERSLRFLDEARFAGFVTHLFALRSFLPDSFGEGNVSLGPVLQALREEFGRLFIKLRIPNYTIAARDIEAPATRTAVESLIREAAAAHGTPPNPAGAELVMRGAFDAPFMATIGERLRSAPQASAVPWAALARLLPDATPQAAHYRTLLTDRLDALSEIEPAAFIDVLQSRSDSVLDSALDVFLTSMRATVVMR